MNNNQNMNNPQNVIMPDNLNPTNPMMQMNNNPSTNNGQENNNRFLNNNVTNTEINDFSAPTNNQQQNMQQQNMQTQEPQDSSINSMNIKDNYNNLDKPGYVSDAQVVENMNNYSQKKTIPITKELKTVIAITVVLLIFIIVMPMLFDLISNLRFN